TLLRRGFRKGKIRADGYEFRFFRNRFHPRYFFGENRKDGKIGKAERATHGAELHAVAKTINEAGTGEWLHVMEDHSNACAGGFEHAQDARKSQREAASRPSEGSVLHQHPGTAPACGLELQSVERLTPAMNLPGHASNL